MNRTLRKALMTKSQLKRRYKLGRISINFENYMKKRNICVNLLRKSKTQHFNNVHVKKLVDNKSFGKLLHQNAKVYVTELKQIKSPLFP